MEKFLKNATENSIVVVGHVISSGETWNVPEDKWVKCNMQQSLIDWINSGDVVVNDGNSDLGIGAALEYLSLSPGDALKIKGKNINLDNLENGDFIKYSSGEWTKSKVSHNELTGIDANNHHNKLHKASHIYGSNDEIDGDKIDIDFSPSSYSPDTSPSEVDNNSELTAHLKGIDNKLGESSKPIILSVSFMDGEKKPYIEVRKKNRWTAVSYFLFPGINVVGTLEEIKGILWSDSSGKKSDYRVYDVTNGKTIANIIGHTSSQIQEVSFQNQGNFSNNSAVWRIDLKADEAHANIAFFQIKC